MAAVSEEVRAPPVLIAHRGFSSRHPEMTRAAYQAAIDWAYETEIPLGLECDVHFSADDELICLHDLTLDRTSTSSGPASERTVAELKQVDFGSRTVPDPAPEERELVTLRELMSRGDARRVRLGSPRCTCPAAFLLSEGNEAIRLAAARARADAADRR